VKKFSEMILTYGNV